MPKYVVYYMNSNKIKKKLFNMAKASVNMANINAQEMLSIPITLPSLDRQKEIVSALDIQFKALHSLHELKNKPNGKLALDLIEKKNVNIIKPSEKGIVDDILTKLAGGDKDIIIATQDMDLKKRLKNSRIITIKQKKYLILTN